MHKMSRISPVKWLLIMSLLFSNLMFFSHTGLANVTTPSHLRESDIGGHSYNIHWRGNTNATHYNIYAKTESGIEELVAVVPERGVTAQLDLVFVIDYSGSMGSYINKVSQQLSQFVATFTNANIDVRLGLLEFADDSCKMPFRKTNFLSSVSLFQQKLQAIRAGGGCGLGESHYEALTQFPHGALHFDFRPDANRQFILVTDEPPYNTMSPSTIVKQMLDQNIVMTVIGPPKGRRGNAELTQLSTGTGGHYIDIHDDSYEIGLQTTAKQMLTQRSYKFIDLQEYTRYTTRITACNGNVCSESSLPLPVRTLDVSPPTVPADLKLTNLTATNATLSWTPSTDMPGSGLKEYDIFRDGQWIAKAAASQTSIEIPDIDLDGVFSISIRARDQVGHVSNMAFITDKDIKRNAPTDIQLEPAALKENLPSGTAIGSFNALDLDAGERFFYVLVAGAGDQSNAQFAIENNKLLAATTFDYEKQKQHSIRVKVIDKYGLSFEETLLIEILNEPEPPTAPTRLRVTDTTSNTVSLSWERSSDDVEVMEYRIYQGETFVMSVSGNAQSATVGGLKSSCKYSFTIRAVDADPNESPASNQVTAMTKFDVNRTYKVGDYFLFGHYHSVPILWRVIQLDSDGNPLLFADRILAFKAFDAAGDFHANNLQRKQYGSNNYADSNIRQWLNSSQANQGADVIDWRQNNPAAANLHDGNNPYDSEAGFLANRNFTNSERAMIAPVTHKVMLAKTDEAKKQGGTTVHGYYTTANLLINNYDTSAYFQEVTDSVFLLSAKQWKEFVYDQRTILGSNYHLAKPTAEAVANSTYKSSNLLNVQLNWLYWLNTPYAASPLSVRYVDKEGSIKSLPANRGDLGIRPALRLKRASIMTFPEGSGDAASPFVVTSEVDSEIPTSPTKLVAREITAKTVALEWTAATDNQAVSGYEIYVNNILVGTVDGTEYLVEGLKEYTKYNITIRAKDDAGNVSEYSRPLDIRTLDITAPTKPSQLTASNITTNSVRLHWTAATDQVGVTHYLIYNGAALIHTMPATKTAFVVSNLKPAITYRLSVKARDAAGNLSEASNVVNVQAKRAMNIVGKSISIDGKPLNLGPGVEPMNLKGSLMVPFRPIFETLGLRVSYNATSKVIEANKNGYVLRMKLNSAVANVNNKANKTMPVAPTSIKGTTMVPLRFVAEELGLIVSYSK
jgi:chitodextrinase